MLAYTYKIALFILWLHLYNLDKVSASVRFSIRDWVKSSLKRFHHPASTPLVSNPSWSIDQNSQSLLNPVADSRRAYHLNDKGTELNKKTIKRRGPFFQGWLVRTVDHQQNTSIIVIIGSFSAISHSDYTQHYLYCAIDRNGHTSVSECFPDPTTVVISKPHRKNILDIQYTSKDHGYFCFNATHSIIDLTLPGLNNVRIESTDRLPWATRRRNLKGPEGWLGYTKLLPCRYYVYSVGSSATYSIQFNNTSMITGKGYSHTECNYGSFFPQGWVWAHAIAENNIASMSLVAGKFAIGLVSPMSFVFYLRRRNGHTAVFRTVDLDTPLYTLDGINNRIQLQFNSKLKGLKASVSIDSLGNDFHRVYIPTAVGFSNQPGCKETYVAQAVVTLEVRGVKENYVFPLTALEFGGSFIGKIIIDRHSQ